VAAISISAAADDIGPGGKRLGNDPRLIEYRHPSRPPPSNKIGVVSKIRVAVQLDIGRAARHLGWRRSPFAQNADNRTSSHAEGIGATIRLV